MQMPLEIISFDDPCLCPILLMVKLLRSRNFSYNPSRPANPGEGRRS
jgi:hypothetical protein